MASVQCFEKPKKAHRQRKHRGHRAEHEMSHAEWYGQRMVGFSLSGYMVEGHGKKAHRQRKHRGQRAESEWYGQREVHFPLPRGYMAEGYGYSAQNHGYSAQNYGYSAKNYGYSAQGRGVEGFGQQVQGLGHKVQAQGAHSSGLATVESQTGCMGQNKGYYLSQSNDVAQVAQVRGFAGLQGNRRELSSCHAMVNKKTEHRKNGSESGSGSESESGSGSWSESGSESESESESDRW
ncbi:hypothetical protein ACJRO7_018241 [Eucalyptus globulus]|uniref:Uncharacterized protein n=1 Tax=Eucalyptus globulus TaxID=34317 RepID=A0ABD3KTV2_EUCGL